LASSGGCVEKWRMCARPWQPARSRHCACRGAGLSFPVAAGDTAAEKQQGMENRCVPFGDHPSVCSYPYQEKNPFRLYRGGRCSSDHWRLIKGCHA
jgi:hypothetical protein